MFTKSLLGSLLLLTSFGCYYSVLQVNIETDPPGPPYQAATYILFKCNVETSLPVLYNWTVLCTSQSSNQVVSRLPNFNNTGVFTLRSRSTPTRCQDTVMCTAIDSAGNTAEASVHIGNVTGVGLWGQSALASRTQLTSEPIANNTAFFANSAGQIGTIVCHSASQQPNIGRWISQAGNDITFTSSDAFQVDFQSGGFPSYTTLQLQQGSALTRSADQGIYSCLIPDENGTEQTLHIGLYPSNYSATLQVLPVRRVSQSPLVINCTSTGLPPTQAVWFLESRILNDSEIYQRDSHLISRTTSTYSNLLTINRNIEDVRGVFTCSVFSITTDPAQSSTSVTTDRHFFGMYVVDDSDTITCSISGATRFEWLLGGQIVASTAALPLTMNDSIHHNLYICQGHNATSLLNGLHVVVIINVPQSALSLSVRSTQMAVIGEMYSVRCIASKNVNGLMNSPVIQSFDPSGNTITNGAGITLTMESSSLLVSFDSLHTSHAGIYICQASLSSPALSSPLVNTEDFNITIQIPIPTASINSTQGQIYAGGRQILACTVLLDDLVDTLVNVSILWRKSGVLISSNSRISVTNVSQISDHEYQSRVTFSPVSMTLDSGQYSCETSVSAYPASPHIADSPPVITSYSLTVEANTGLLVVDVTPSSTSVPEQTSSSLICTAILPDSFTVIKTFRWLRTAPGGTAATALSQNISVANANSPTSVSILTVRESVAGIYAYTCIVRVDVPGDPSLMVSANASVSVIAQPQCRRMFQLFLGETTSCSDLRLDGNLEGLGNIVNSIVSAVNARCQCSLITSTDISNQEFRCTDDDRVALFRAELSGTLNCTDVITHIEDWVQSGQASVVIQNNRIEVNLNCAVEIQSFSDPPDCMESTAPETVPDSNLTTTAIVIGTVGVLVIAIIVSFAIFICKCFLRRRKRYTSQAERCRTINTATVISNRSVLLTDLPTVPDHNCVYVSPAEGEFHEAYHLVSFKNPGAVSMEQSGNVGESPTLIQREDREDDHIYDTIDEDGDTYIQMNSSHAVKPATKMEETYLHVIM